MEPAKKKDMAIGVLTLELRLPGCTSLKEKRGRLKPLLTRLHREFNLSAAEMDRQDEWQEAVITCAVVGNDAAHLQRTLQTVLDWVEKNWRDVTVVDDQFELV
jgi:uncharacterized protein YlxP (DUF503 family)